MMGEISPIFAFLASLSYVSVSMFSGIKLAVLSVITSKMSYR